MRVRALLAACQVPTAPAPVVAPCPLNTAPGRLNTWVRVYAEGGAASASNNAWGLQSPNATLAQNQNPKAQIGLKTKLES